MGVDSKDRLRLRASDAEDLGVIAACLQDARIPVREMLYEPEKRRFTAVFVRYRRERQADPASCDGLSECQSALQVDEVGSVRWRGLDPEAPAREMVLLTIATEPGRDEALYIDLVFEGDTRIRLIAPSIAARLEDFGEPVPCKVTPCDHLASGLPGWTEAYDYVPERA